MFQPVIQLSAFTDANPVQGELYGSAQLASIQFFEGLHSSPVAEGISLSFQDGPLPRSTLSYPDTEFGELRCISQSCVSDVSLIQEAPTLSGFDADLLLANNMIHTGQLMTDETSIESLGSSLLGALPQVKQALGGELDATQLSQLIAELQSQLLELNSVTQDNFGDMTSELSLAVQEAEAQDTDSLLAALQQDAGLFTGSNLDSSLHGLVSEATLDGLFTAPEAFPLTLDFSNKNGIQEASELFAATSSAQSISSTARAGESDESLFGSNPASTDFS